MDQINVELLSECILPFIGDYQFRFIAGVNHTFYMAYTNRRTKRTVSDDDVFVVVTNNNNASDETMMNHQSNINNHNDKNNSKATYYNVSTKQHAKICYEETTTLPERRLLCALTARNGNLPILQYLHEEFQCPWDVSTCTNAGKYGHLSILKYARQYGCDWNDQTCIYAAMNGHLHILQWACTNGLNDASTSLSVYVSSSAAEYGHFAILQWLHSIAAPFHDDVTQYAAKNGREEIVQWLCARGY